MEYKKVQDISPAQAAYLAGLIDGEGTVTLSRRNRNKHRGLVVTISNTEMILLKHVQTITGVGKITNKRIAQPIHTPSYTYQVTNRQALGLLGGCSKRPVQPGRRRFGARSVHAST